MLEFILETDQTKERRQVRILEQELLLADFSQVNEWQSGKRRLNTSKEDMRI